MSDGDDSELEDGEIPPTPPREMIIQREPKARARSPPDRHRTPTTPRRRKRSRSPEHRKSPRSTTKQSQQHGTPPRTDGRPPTDCRRSVQRSDRVENGRHGARRPLREDSPAGSQSRQPRRRSPSPVRRQRSEPRSIADSLAADIQRLTNDTGVPQAMQSLDTVSDRLASALRKLEKFAAVAKAGSPSETVSEQLAALAGSVFAGLRSAHVVLGTAQGQAAAGDATRDLFAAAMRKREQLFSDSQASTLEGWVHTTKALRPEAPVATRPDGAAAAPGGAVIPSKKLPDASALVAAAASAAVAAAASSRTEPFGNGSTDNGPVAKSAPPPPPPPAEVEPVAVHQVQHAAAAAAVPDTLLGGYDPFMAAHGATQHEEQAAQQQADSGYYVQPAAPQPHYASASSVQSANGRMTPGEVEAPSTAQPVETSALSSAILGDVNSLLQRRQLCLVLDLDHTLVNSTRFSEVTPDLEIRLRGLLNLPNAAERHLYELPQIQMWTKLRPGVQHFLSCASECFELWIHTNGSRSYAMAVVELIDPTGRLFGPRIIAQGSGDPAQVDLAKRLKAGLEGREMVSIIVDDTSSVWSEHPENLFLVEPYVFFPGQRVTSRSLLEAERDEVAEHGMLSIARDVLLRVHDRVFEALSTPPTRGADGKPVFAKWDVPHILQLERSEVLRGVVIMFSRIIPLDEVPSQHALWLRAEAFGARCTAQTDDAVTHLVTNTQHTLKAQWARETGKFVVSEGWLKCSCTLWRRARESDFAVPDSAPA